MRYLIGVFVLALCLNSAVQADEGMWLFNKPPRKMLKDRYNFEADDAWLEHLQKASVRFNSGGSASFVSSEGLVMTNHHVGADALQKISDKEGVDYVKNGFHARKRSEEKKCIGMELNVLMSIEDVTPRVQAAVKEGMKAAEAFQARRAVISEIENDSLEKTGLRSNVVTLYQGAQYHLYRFKSYTDVRLVFAPEKQAAFYGGDPDNFEYPRFDLDICFFRVYENDKPVTPEHYLKWSADGAKEGDLVFVSGHPGRTNRLNTVAELDYLRGTGMPYLLSRLYRWEVLLSNYSGRSAENARKAEDMLFGVANTRKARRGGLAGLLDPEIMARKIAEEQTLLDAASKDEKLKANVEAWESIAKVQARRTKILKPYTLLEGSAGLNSELFGIARTLVRASEELPKDNADRLREFNKSNLASLKLQLFSEEKIFEDYEILKLADGLSFLCEELGPTDPLVKQILAGKSPQARATELVKGTQVQNVTFRKRLFEGGAEVVNSSADPMILLAKLIDPMSRKVRKEIEEIEEIKSQAYAKIAAVKYAVQGDSTYPDATFTLRLAFGTVKGYSENGKPIPAFTTFAGLYERAAEQNNKPPFDLPPRWSARKDRLNLNTPFNFVSTNDIIGGNSGSPVVNRKGEVVGIIFDGNIQSLVWDFVYTDEQARAVSVASQGIIEALNKVYDASELVGELTGKKAEEAPR